MSRDDKLTINGLHRNSVHTTIDEDIGIPDTYIHRPIVGLYSNYNYNYNSGSSVRSPSTKPILMKQSRLSFNPILILFLKLKPMRRNS